MKYLALISLLLSGWANAQPLRHKHEIVIEKHGIKVSDCAESLGCLIKSNTKVSVNLITGQLGDFQYAGVFKLNRKSLGIDKAVKGFKEGLSNADILAAKGNHESILEYEDVNKSSNDGRIGGQVWKKLNKYAWVGAELTANLDLDLDNEILFALDIPYTVLNTSVTAYMAVKLKEEQIGLVGFKAYMGNSVTISVESDIKKTEDNYSANELRIGVGIVISDKVFEDFQKALNLKK